MICFKLFMVFFVTGLFTIGGGYAMIPMITELLLKNQWATQDEIVNFIAISESTPGPFAVNIATFVGFEQYGFFGAIASVFGVILPSFIIIVLIAKFFFGFSDNFYVRSALYGLSPTVIGLIFSAGASIAINNFFGDMVGGFSFSSFDYKSFFIFIVIGCVVFFKKIHPIFVVIISAVLGVILYGI
ncbi:MAG: chromate transporter [Oscillospiraceae bacterium]